MEELIRIIYNNYKKPHIVKEDFIYDVCEIFSKYYELEKYFKDVVIINAKTPSLAYYSPQLKTIYVNIYKLIKTTGYYIAQNENISIYEEKILAVNLYILKVLLHEIEHIVQERIIRDGQENIEKEILIASFNNEQNLKDNKEYSNKKYYTNPIERQAEIKSLNQINRIANETNNETVFRFFERELLITAMNDYKIGESINVYPYQYFFNNYKKEIIKDIEEIQMLKDNYDLRIQLGLAISHREYNVLKRKLIIN